MSKASPEELTAGGRPTAYFIENHGETYESAALTPEEHEIATRA